MKRSDPRLVLVPVESLMVYCESLQFWQAPHYKIPALRNPRMTELPHVPGYTSPRQAVVISLGIRSQHAYTMHTCSSGQSTVTHCSLCYLGPGYISLLHPAISFFRGPSYVLIQPAGILRVGLLQLALARLLMPCHHVSRVQMCT